MGLQRALNDMLKVNLLTSVFIILIPIYVNQTEEPINGSEVEQHLVALNKGRHITVHNVCIELPDEGYKGVVQMMDKLAPASMLDLHNQLSRTTILATTYQEYLIETFHPSLGFFIIHSENLRFKRTTSSKPKEPRTKMLFLS